MSFPRYLKYKPSGVEWLGEVPEGWEVKPLRSVFKFSKGLTITKDDLRDEGVCCVNYGEIHSKYGFRLNPKFHPLRCVEPEYLSSNPDALIHDGDFVFADTSEDLAGSGNFTHLRSENPIFAGYHTIIGRPCKDNSPLLLAYQIHSSAFRSQIQKQVKGVKVFSISQGILKAAKCLLPPLPEQTAIAEFLDRETAKIDGLVAEQRRLIELLKEKRQAVISHAVTKGLNPHAPMKPSGIEWLGDVPEHWEVTRLGFLCSKIGSGKTPLGGGEAYLTEGILFIRSQNVYDDGLYLDDVVYVSDATDAEQSWSRVLSGDILLNITGASLGRTCLVPDDFQAANVNQHVCILRLSSLAFRHFVSMVLKSSGMKSQFDAAQNGAAREGLNFAQISKLALALPPEGEQACIIKFLDTKLAKFDTLTAEAQRAIDLLQERRTALISAAVTGQIDVRPQTQN